MSDDPRDELAWLPPRGIMLSRTDLERIFIDLRALIRGTDALEPNRAIAVDIATVLAAAIEREEPR